MPDFTFGSPPRNRSNAADTSAALKNMVMKYANTMNMNNTGKEPVCPCDALFMADCPTVRYPMMDNMASPMAEKMGNNTSSRSFMSTPQLIFMSSNVWPIVANMDVNAPSVSIVWLHYASSSRYAVCSVRRSNPSGCPPIAYMYSAALNMVFSVWITAISIISNMTPTVMPMVRLVCNEYCDEMI